MQLKTCIALTIVLAANLGAQTANPWPAGAAKYRLYLVGQGHLDAVWLWPWHEALSEVHSTFRSVLDRMKENPEFTFTAAESVFYRWVEENDPEMLREIRQRVEEGRWGLAGGWWVEADANAPNGESLVRQGLYGQLTLRRLFGRITTVANNPDAAGHPATLPQILKMQGMENFVFTRPRPDEKELPDGLFWWEGIDGTRVLAYRPPLNYASRGSLEPGIRRLITEMKPTTRSLMVFVGAGDHGGGPTKANIRELAQLRSQPGAPVMVYSIPERYFAEVRKAGVPGIPLVRDELQHHARGGYTNVSEMRKNNRTAEAALTTSEKLAALGSVVWGVTYRKADFTSAWERVLFQQFHDSINGVSLPEHYEVAGRDAYGFALDIARDAMYKAAQRLAWRIPAEDPESTYLVVFNPNAWEVTTNAQYELNLDRHTPVRVEDERGNVLPHQWTAGTVFSSANWRVLVARVRVPALGYRQIRIRKETAKAPAASDLRAEGNILENAHLRVTFAPSGAIGIFDKDTGRELFQGGATGARAVVLNDPHDTWANIVAFDQDIAAFGNAKIRVLESGPLRAAVRVRTTYGASTLTTDWILYSGSRALEARVALNWNENRKMLKFSFPVDVTEPRATHEVAYGHIVREANGGEEPGQRWIDLTGRRQSGEYGLAVINDAKYGYSVKGNDMRISVVRSPLYGHRSGLPVDPNVDYNWQNQGLQTFRMLLMPHQGAWQDAGVVRAAEEFINPVPVVYQGIHPGTRPQADSFLSVDAPNVVVSAIKMAESGNDLIFRCYETAGRPALASIDFRFAKKRWSGKFRPSEIKTLRMDTRTGTIREVNLLEE